MKKILKQNILKAISKFKNKKVLIVGDLMLDLYIQGPPRSVSQEAPVIIVQTNKKYYKLGGAANSAENIKALGARAYLAGVIGDHNKHDDFGRSFLQTIKKSKVTHDGIFFDHTRPTTLKMRIMSQNQQIVRVDEEVTKKINKKIETKLYNYIKKTLPKMDVVFVSDYNKGVVTDKIMKLITELGSKNKIKVVVDPKPQNKNIYHNIDFITPNDIEMSQMFGDFEVNQKQLINYAVCLKKENNIENILVTRGANGMDIINSSGKTQHIPSLAKKVIDVSGAGDTVAAIICMGINHLTPYEVSYLASIGAKISIEKQGTSTVSINEIKNNLK